MTSGLRIHVVEFTLICVEVLGRVPYNWLRRSWCQAELTILLFLATALLIATSPYIEMTFALLPVVFALDAFTVEDTVLFKIWNVDDLTHLELVLSRGNRQGIFVATVSTGSIATTIAFVRGIGTGWTVVWPAKKGNFVSANFVTCTRGGVITLSAIVLSRQHNIRAGIYHG